METISLRLSFQIKQWRAWLPPERRPLQARGWPNGDLLEGEVPDIDYLPLLQRRRLTPMAKVAIATAWPCIEQGKDVPRVCASLHGETGYCFHILKVLAEGGDVSPTEFTLSVHSAVGALLSQYSASRAPFVALAPGQEGYSAALLEAQGFLQAPATTGIPVYSEVVVLLYEQPLPPVYHGFISNPAGIMALALRLGTGSDKGLQLQAERLGGSESQSGDSLLSLILALCQRRRRVRLPALTGDWIWRFSDEGH